MVTTFNLAFLACVSSLPFNVKPAIGISLLSPSISPIAPPPSIEYGGEVHLPQTLSVSNSGLEHTFTSPDVIVQPEYAKSLKRLLYHSTSKKDLPDLIARMRSIDEQFDFAFNWQEIVRDPKFFLDNIQGIYFLDEF
jgi:hypothetical protein